MSRYSRKIINPVPLKFNCMKHKQKRKKKMLCCNIISDSSTQLVPAAKKGSTHVEKEVFAEIEKICNGVVIICGFIRKRIKYRGC